MALGLRLLRRAVAGVFAAISLAVAASPFLYHLQFGSFPPTRLNLLAWVAPVGDDCVSRAVNTEDIPWVGTGVGLGDMCPFSKFGPGTYESVLVGPGVWVVLLAALAAGLALAAWPRRGADPA